tara:strand:+ start:568 stop:732 length:165 start_codon:yes stop_codon:yes gene_type:complete
MRYFKKEGNVKFKKSNDKKYIEGLIKEGWEEVNNDGSSVNSKPKKEDLSGNKED